MLTVDAYIDQVLNLLPRGTPLRDQIALELRSIIAERLNAGQTDADVLRQLGDPKQLAESYLSSVRLEAALVRPAGSRQARGPRRRGGDHHPGGLRAVLHGAARVRACS